MAETFELYLDGTQMNDVPKLDEFTEILERDYGVRGLVFKYPNTITLFGDAFKYMYDLWVSGGYCQTVNIIIQKSSNESQKFKIDGLIFMSDVQWMWDSGSVEVTIEDNSWSARILNNWTLPVNLKSTLTKNGEAITPPGWIELEVYDPTAVLATYLGTTRKGIDIQSALKHMIEFVSDNKVTFLSNFLTNLDYDLWLGTGNALRTGQYDTIELTLEFLLESIMTTYNLWFTIIDDKDGTYTFQIEPYEELFDTEPTQQFSYIKDVKQSIDTDKLYSSVTVGGEAKKDLDGTLSLPYYRMTTFFEEDYYFNGTCNLDNRMTMRYAVIYDTNIIEDLVVYNNDDYDDGYFVIQYTEPVKGTFQAVKNKYADTATSASAPYYYNEPMLNTNIVNRYELPNNLFQTFGDDGDTFRALLGSDSANIKVQTTTVSPMIFTNEIFDTSGSYNPANGRYQAGANGTYTFEVNMFCALNIQENPADNLTVRVDMVVRNSGGTSIETISGTEQSFDGQLTIDRGGLAFQYTQQFTQYLDLNATVEMNLSLELENQSGVYGASGVTQYKYFGSSSFDCIATADGGGEFVTSNPINYRCVKLAFSDAVSDEEWNTLKANPSAMYLIDRDGQKNMRAWVSMIKRNILTSEVEAEFITNLAQANKIGI